MKDALGDRMKGYEQAEAGRVLALGLPILARLDGRSFHTFTRNVARPFSAIMHRLMVDVTRYLVEESGAVVGYTQSDEISLGWWAADPSSQMFFGGNVAKLCSSLAAMASLRLQWQALVGNSDQERDEARLKSGLRWAMLPTFDCRVWTVPSLDEAANAFVWRQADARRNSVSMAAHHFFPAKSLDGMTSTEKRERLKAEVGVDWDAYPAAFKRGTFVRRVKVVRGFTADEIAQLPAKHAARTNPDLTVERGELREEDLELAQLPERVAMLFGVEADPAR